MRRRDDDVGSIAIWVFAFLAMVGIATAGNCDDRYGYPEPQPWVRHPRPNFALAMLGDGRVFWYGPQRYYYDEYEPRYYAPRPYVVPRAYANPCRTQGNFVVDWRQVCDRTR